MFRRLLQPKKKRDDESYYDYDDSLIRFENPLKHDGPNELAFVASQESRVVGPGDVMYIIDSSWLEQW